MGEFIDDEAADVSVSAEMKLSAALTLLRLKKGSLVNHWSILVYAQPLQSCLKRT